MPAARRCIGMTELSPRPHDIHGRRDPMPPQTTYAVREDAGTGPSPAIPISSELSVLVPTRNEAGNIEELLRRVSAAVTGISTDIVFIDDSDDTTPAVVRAVVRR